MNTILTILPAVIASELPPTEALLYDTLWRTDDCLWDNAYGNALSGRGVFGDLYDLRLADDFELNRAAVLETVTADYICFNGTGCTPNEGVYVRIYADRQQQPLEPPLFEERFDEIEVEYLNLGFWCGPHAMGFPRITVRGIDLLVPAGTYWINIQPVDTTEWGDWYYHWAVSEGAGPGSSGVGPAGTGASAHVRDGDLGEGYWGHQEWRSTEEHDYGHVLIAMRLTGHWATVCDRIDSLRTICRRGRLRVAVESSLPEGKRLTVVNGERQRRMTIRKDGRGRVHFDEQGADGQVAIEGCPEWTTRFQCQ